MCISIAFVIGLYKFFETKQGYKKYLYVGILYVFFILLGICFSRFHSQTFIFFLSIRVWDFLFGSVLVTFALPIYFYELRGYKKEDKLVSLLLYTVLGPYNSIFSFASNSAPLFSKWNKGLDENLDIGRPVKGIFLLVYSALCSIALTNGKSYFLEFFQHIRSYDASFILIFLFFLFSFGLLYLFAATLFHSIVGFIYLWGFSIPTMIYYPFLSRDFLSFFRKWMVYYREVGVRLFFYPLQFKFKSHKILGTLLAGSSVFLFVTTIHILVFFRLYVLGIWSYGKFLYMSIWETYLDVILALWIICSFLISSKIKFKKMKNIMNKNILLNFMYKILSWLIFFLIVSFMWFGFSIYFLGDEIFLELVVYIQQFIRTKNLYLINYFWFPFNLTFLIQ